MPQTSVPQTSVRPRTDAVGALLGQIWDDALDPGYAIAAAQRSAQPDRPRLSGWRTVLALALVGLVLAVAAASTAANRPAVAERRMSLVERIDTQTAAYDATTAALAALETQVDRLKSDQLGATGAGEALTADIARLAAIAGETGVVGPGVVVTVDDAVLPAGAGSDQSLGRVLDADLQLVVNGLWASGAEAIAINGVRLTSLSSIRSAGDAILVDYRPLARPYVVTAIGDPASIEARFASGPGGRGLRTLSEAYGVRFSVATDPALTLTAAAAASLRYARSR